MVASVALMCLPHRLRPAEGYQVMRAGAAIGVLVALVALTPVKFIAQSDIGLVYRFEALTQRTLGPGLRFVLPIDVVHHVRVTEQTDALADVACDTNDGATFAFTTIEVESAVVPASFVLEHRPIFMHRPTVSDRDWRGWTRWARWRSRYSCIYRR
jgi:hypothetical protein